MKSWQVYTALLVLGMTCGGASATPTSTGHVAIVDTTDSQAFPDTEDAERLWVLPPTSGTAQQSTLSMETPAAECDAMRNLVEASRLYTSQIKTLAAQRENLLTRLGNLNDKNTAEAIQIYSTSETINTLILSAYKTINTMVGESARSHGGTLNIPYTHHQADNIASIRTANPSYSDVRPIETFRARFYFSAPGSVQDGLDLSLLPIINSYSVGGIKADQLATSTAQVASRIDVTLSLTRIGACMMNYPEKFGIQTAPKFGMTALYEYPFSFRSSISASYNLKNIYKFLKQSGSSGGLFSSSSWSKTLESNWGESSIKFLWSESDPESKVTVADRIEIEKSVKADLLANIDRLILAKAGIAPAQAANPGPHGATVIADGLDKTCSPVAYCAAASIALRGLDAIFGSSSMSTEVEKRLDVTATYKMDSSLARYVGQGISYSAD